MNHGAPDHHFWRDKYRAGHTPWDLGGISGPVLTLVQQWAPEPCRVIVPGCGRGHEALYLAARGYRVTAVDLVTEPLDELRAVAAARGLGPSVLRVLQADLFALPAVLDGTFDVFLEQTCLCALPPARYPDYEALAWRLLRPGGEVLGVYMQTGCDDGPPYDNPPEQVFGLFSTGHWEREGPLPVHPRNPARPGPEYLARFRRHADRSVAGVDRAGGAQ